MHQRKKQMQSPSNKALVLDGLDEAIRGVSDCGKFIYDFNKVIKIFTNRDGMTVDEAVEYIEYNVMGVQGNGDGFIMMYPDWEV